ncbi:MAG: PilT protein domain protein [Candidatus Magasanikbacteria bacterium GW2011_GWA2_45_39]|uniref:PilT protein domain protein n=1 Tax=Candidatus Magasanikbacteria bacterium GW2011_GWA2_45_39 TaxID=1619041 RepID=A0A0G1QCQ1_9BACT|nr:MAG: PilT protein domain protein [Candidatus Magasanikbacteria bacterium GW2011_GWA2_45_39]
MRLQLDTNALLRYTTNDIPKEADMVEVLIKKAKEGTVSLYICEPIFIETAVMLKQYFKFPKGKIVSILSFLINSPELHIENRQGLLRALGVYAEYSVDFVDCVLLVRTQMQNQQIFTFDVRLSLLASSQEKAN